MNQTASRLDLVDRILSRNLSWVAAADAKIAPILAIDTAMLGFIAALAPAASKWTAPQSGVTAIAGLLLLGSLGCLAAAVFPRLEGPKSSRVFFGGIAPQDREAYVESISCGESDELVKDFGRQCHRNAEIALAKFGFIRSAMILLFLSIVPWLASVALLYSSRGVPAGCS
jgi:hypothetical protein